MKNGMLWMGRMASGALLGMAVCAPLWAESIYYPGYLAYYPYGDGSFVYALPRQELPPPETHMAPAHAPRVMEAPSGLPAPSVASFSPNQAELSRVMLGGFSVHVGSYLKASDAEEMEDRLQQVGVPFFLSPAMINGTSYTQLHAGPFQIQDQAFDASDLIRDKLGVQGIVLSHGPQRSSAGK
ncbi:MAG: SPOR domain-containing protein [Magnetococcales bacterium]|nr:SPOR domain-containing protein [Magnetococcales bacterium]